MEVVFGSYVIASGERESPRGLRIGLGRQVQVTALTRAENAKVFPRKNNTHSIAFAVDYLKEDVPEAIDFMLNLYKSIPQTKEELAFTTYASNGVATITTFENATLVNMDTAHLGATVTVTFAFVAENVKELPEP